jgi:NADH-quinone oxidoreductase subunit A
MQPTLTPLAAVVLLFLAVGVGFIFFHLLAGKFIRPNKPAAEKKTIYECGEPTIGSAWIQFDLRFYVVALLFVIFDVEVAFFFPWAEVFGKAHAVAFAPKPPMPSEGDKAAWQAYRDEHGEMSPEERKALAAWQEYSEKVNAMVPDRPDMSITREHNLRPANDPGFALNRSAARELVWLSLAEIAVFFGVLLVGFAYLWRRGDLEWVRSTLAERPTVASAPMAATNGAPIAVSPSGGTLVEAGS